MEEVVSIVTHSICLSGGRMAQCHLPNEPM